MLLLLGQLPCRFDSANVVFFFCCSEMQLALKDQNFYISLYFFFCVVKSINGFKNKSIEFSLFFFGVLCMICFET